jgi:3-hydroxyacyl-CoA dehydrogenase
MRQIERAAVLGSGVMGGAIAAHLANCGISSIMLDIVPPNLSGTEKSDPAKRNSIAQASKQALLKAKPSPVYLASNVAKIEIGNFDDDMARIAECDWIIEVVKEDLEIKKKIFSQVANHRTPGSVVSSNTSGISIRAMAEVMDQEMGKHFLGTHFFNPPRYLKLVEIIPGPDTLPEVIAFMAQFLENRLGKGVVYAKDTPNFIANRILTFGSQFILHEMAKDGLTVEEVDALTGPAVGHASSATFRTFDLVGLDTYVHVVGNVRANAPDDERRDVLAMPEFVTKMVEKGYIGAKVGRGFYQKTEQRDEKGKPVIKGLDIATLEYRDPVKPRFESVGAARQLETLEEKIKVMHTGEDKGSQFVWKLFAHTAIYAANRIPEVSDDIVNIDNAVKWGFAWEIGIFEAWDVLGFEYVVERMRAEGFELPPIAKAIEETGNSAFYRTQNGGRQYFDLQTKSYQDVPLNPRVLHLKGLKDQKRVVKENGSCTLIDLGDDILCAEFHTKMNTIDTEMGLMLAEAVRMLNEDEFAGMVIGNQGDHFCAGANIFVVLGEAMQENWAAVEQAVNDFQQVNMAIRFCRRPIVAAPHHYTFGGGVEICQHTARCVIAGETYGGLVEVGVGLIPGGGGCKEMLRRAQAYIPDNVIGADHLPYVRRAFENIAMAKVSTSGPEMVELGYLSKHDIISSSLDQQIKRAKDVCLALNLAGYEPPPPAQLVALGANAQAAIRVAIYGMQQGGFASEHDALISTKIGYILTGGNRREGATMTEQDVLDLEREVFVSLCGMEKTQQRIQHMLTTGKPLRN